ncbi:Type I phosphodiesterase/nucleotide pyrophosphatase [Desulfovibrionales bacterium]
MLVLLWTPPKPQATLAHWPSHPSSCYTYPMPTPRPRLVVLGFDGLPFSLAHNLSRQGQLPNLASLALTQQATSIMAELPELSPVNWTSLATATGPEVHGIFGFTRIDLTTYTIGLADANYIRCPTIFEHLGRTGRVSKVINLPGTYPARPMRGILIAGFPAPNLSRAVFPSFLAGPLTTAGYILEADTATTGHNPNRLLIELHRTLAARRIALDLLWPDLAWDLFVFVLTETDRLFHFLFPACTDPAHTHYGDCMAFLTAWDRVVGEILERFAALPEPKRLLALSDHGFTTLKTEVDINVWLRKQGYLQLTPTMFNNSVELDGTRILSSSRAFALDPGRIHLHLAGRYSRGSVAATEVPTLTAAIKAGLEQLTWYEEPVMETVFHTAELYPGILQGGLLPEGAPDLVCLARPGFDLKAKFDRDAIFATYHRHGTHTARDLFYYDSDAGTQDIDPTITRVRDVGVAILRWFGCPNTTAQDVLVKPLIVPATY